MRICVSLYKLETIWVDVNAGSEDIVYGTKVSPSNFRDRVSSKLNWITLRRLQSIIISENTIGMLNEQLKEMFE